MAETFDIKNQPSASELWQGIGGHFDSLGQIINEFLDNSISDFMANASKSRTITITLKELSSNGPIEIMIEDSASGIKDLDAAFTLGNTSAGESPLNEHGFGLKHALASADPENKTWMVCTRTADDVEKESYKKIEAPYKIDGFMGETCDNSSWPGRKSSNETGTVVKFTCTRELFKTLGQGIQGGVSAFNTLSDILFEDIGFTYSGLIANQAIDITLILQRAGKNEEFKHVGAVQPDWANYISPGKGTEPVNLGNGIVDIEYAFGVMNDKPERKSFDNKTTRKYYRRNMSSSGVEVRSNGRVICHNLFKEIWGLEKHNSYNHLLITIDLKSDNSSALPKTRTSKNGFREGDPRLEKLFEWIRSNMKEPPKNVSLTDHEVDLFEQLRQKKEKYNPDRNKVLRTEMPVFTKTGNTKDRVRIDLYEKTMGEVNIYEGKKDSTSSKDVYQLRMYWDGLVYDGVTPTRGILLASEHPDSVEDLIKVVNTMRDQDGNYYHLETKTWSDV